MKKLLYITLGITLVFITSATTVNIMTVKPANPKYISVKEFTSSEHREQGKYINKMLKEGWILKSQVLAGGDSYYYGIVVMEKY